MTEQPANVSAFLANATREEFRAWIDSLPQPTVEYPPVEVAVLDGGLVQFTRRCEHCGHFVTQVYGYVPCGSHICRRGGIDVQVLWG